MSVAFPAVTKGACPGALCPMEAGDGLIVRVRPRLGTLTVEQALAVAEAARGFGNGHIDLTRRANLQVRGVRAPELPAVQALLDGVGLLDASPEAEAVRNIVVSPLAGIDPDEVLDARPLGQEVERLIASEPALWRLPGKFGFLIDGGGALSLAGERADIRLEAHRVDVRAAVAIAIDRPNGTCRIGAVSPEDAPRAAALAALAFVDAQVPGSRARMRDAGDDVPVRIRNALVAAELLTILPIERLAGFGNTLPFPLPSSRSWRSHASHGRQGSRTPGQKEPEACLDPDLRRDDVGGGADRSSLRTAPPIGRIAPQRELLAVGIGAPLGRVEGAMLEGLVAAASAVGARELRLSPWRVLYVPLRNESDAVRLLEAADGLGFIVDPGDPLSRIEACPGAPACRSAALDTHRAAAVIARFLPQLDGIASVHVSGCAKGCARSSGADLVLAGGCDRFAIIRNGRADGPPRGSIAPRDLERLPEVLAACEGGAENV